MNKTCDYRPDQPDNIENELDAFLETVSLNTDYMMTQEIIDKSIDLITINQKMTFIKCWLESKETDCDFLVLNTVFYNGNYLIPTFSVNLDPTVAHLFLDNITLGKSLYDFSLL